MTALRELMMWLLVVALTLWVVRSVIHIELLETRVEKLETRQ